MKTVHAVWEKRNIGVDCVEFAIEKDDGPDEVARAIAENEAEYMVVKIPSGMVDALLELQQKGFLFIECSFSLARPIETILALTRADRVKYGVSYSIMEDSGVERLFSEIRSGMFTTDRISMDPYFSLDQAANRYIGWIKDALSRGAELLQLVWESQNVGFCAVSDAGGGTYVLFLAGIYPEFIGKGLGYAIIDCSCNYMRQKGGVTFATTVATNNQASLRLHLKYGCLPNSCNYVLVKHATSLR